MMERYEKYKDSGVEWIGEILEGWEIKKLKYILKIGSGDGIKSEAIKDFGYFPVYGGNGLVGYTNKYNNNDKVFVIGRVGAKCGNVRLVSGKKWISDNALYAYSKGNLDFIENSLISKDFNKLANKNAQPLITSTMIKEESILFPPLIEQTSIANYLDRKTAEIDELIAQKERLLELYEEEKIAIINKAVTKGINPDVKLKDSGINWLGEIPERWEVKKLRYLFDIRKRIVGELGFDVLSITQKGIRVKDIISMDGQISSDYSKYQLVEKGDFAMNHMDLLTGYVDISKNVGVTSPDYRVFSLTDKKSFKGYYLYLFQIGYKNKIFYAFGRGAAHFGRWRFPADEFKEFTFPYPPLKEQTAIVQHIETETARINAKITKTKKIITLQKEYRTALVSEVVTGKIRVTEGGLS